MNYAEKIRELEELTGKLEAYREKLFPLDAAQRARPRSPDPGTRCPTCGGEAESGHLEIHGTFLGFLAFGFSYEHCWFVPKHGEEEIALKSAGIRKGFRCSRCGTIVML